MPRKPYKWLNIPKRKFPHPGDDEKYDYDVQKTFNGIKKVTRSWIKKVAIRVDGVKEERLVDIRDLEEYELLKRGQLKALYDKIDYYPELGEHICREVAEGKLLFELCKEDGMPGYPTVNKWLMEHKEFRENMALVVKMTAKADSDKVKQISLELISMLKEASSMIKDIDTTDASQLKKVQIAADKQARLLQGAASAVKVAAGNLEWIASKHDPDTYGDKIEIKDERPHYNLLIQGRNGGQSQQFVNVTPIPPPLPDIVEKSIENRELIEADNRDNAEKKLDPILQAKLNKARGVKEDE